MVVAWTVHCFDCRVARDLAVGKETMISGGDEEVVPTELPWPAIYALLRIVEVVVIYLYTKLHGYGVEKGTVCHRRRFYQPEVDRKSHKSESSTKLPQTHIRSSK